MSAPLRAVPDDDGGGIVWEDPRSPRKGTTNHDKPWLRRLAPLVESPGEWARVQVKPTAALAAATAGNLRRILTIPPGRWEFASRLLPDGTGGVYARYVGPDDPA